MALPIQYQIAVGDPVQSYLDGLKFGEDLKTQRLERDINQFNLTSARQDRQAAAAAALQAQKAQEQGMAALQGLINDPNPSTRDYLNAWAQNPALRQEILDLKDMQTSEQNNELLSRNVKLYAAATSGNVSVVSRILQEELDAARNSGDEERSFITEAGLELLKTDPTQALGIIKSQSALMLLGIKDPKFLEEVNTALGAGTPEQTDAFKTLHGRAIAAGLTAGTPEYEAFMLNNGDIVSNGFRRASSEEAARYGAAAGQFGPDGRFYPVNPPSGMELKTHADGSVSLIQGPNAGSGRGGLSETQSKSVTYATRARGALKIFDPVADHLTSRSDQFLGIFPVGLGRDYQDPMYQVAQNAGTEFLHAILRKDTGAAITQEENEQYGKVYLPQPGDSPEVLKTKKEARMRALNALEAGMSPEAMLALETASGSENKFATMTIDEYNALSDEEIDAMSEAQALMLITRLKELGL